MDIYPSVVAGNHHCHDLQYLIFYVSDQLWRGMGWIIILFLCFNCLSETWSFKSRNIQIISDHEDNKPSSWCFLIHRKVQKQLELSQFSPEHIKLDISSSCCSYYSSPSSALKTSKSAVSLSCMKPPLHKSWPSFLCFLCCTVCCIICLNFNESDQLRLLGAKTHLSRRPEPQHTDQLDLVTRLLVSWSIMLRMNGQVFDVDYILFSYLS